MNADEDGIDTDEQIDKEGSQSDLVHKRLRESPIKRWILLDGSRYLITGLFSIIVLSRVLALQSLAISRSPTLILR